MKYNNKLQLPLLPRTTIKIVPVHFFSLAFCVIFSFLFNVQCVIIKKKSHSFLVRVQWNFRFSVRVIRLWHEKEVERNNNDRTNLIYQSVRLEAIYCAHENFFLVSLILHLPISCPRFCECIVLAFIVGFWHWFFPNREWNAFMCTHWCRYSIHFIDEA